MVGMAATSWMAGRMVGTGWRAGAGRRVGARMVGWELDGGQKLDDGFRELKMVDRSLM